MILEVATLDIFSGQEREFQNDFEKAVPIISAMKGFVGLDLKRCIENPSRFVLLVRWETLADHTEGFRGSPAYQDWKNLLNHHYESMPTVEHFESVVPGTGPQNG